MACLSKLFQNKSEQEKDCRKVIMNSSIHNTCLSTYMYFLCREELNLKHKDYGI